MTASLCAKRRVRFSFESPHNGVLLGFQDRNFNFQRKTRGKQEEYNLNLNCQLLIFLNTTTPLCPPNPKLSLIATFTPSATVTAYGKHKYT